MNNKNQVCQAARINFYPKPFIQLHFIITEQNEKEAQLYSDDDFEHEYCMNTTTWD